MVLRQKCLLLFVKDDSFLESFAGLLKAKVRKNIAYITPDEFPELFYYWQIDETPTVIYIEKNKEIKRWTNISSKNIPEIVRYINHL